MAKGKIFRDYKMLSSEDQLTFDLWLNGNAIVGFVLAAGLVAMAWASSNSVAPHDAVATDRTNASISRTVVLSDDAR